MLLPCSLQLAVFVTTFSQEYCLIYIHIPSHMSLIRKLNTKAKTEINTGFGVNSSDYGGRFVNKSGRANIQKRGIPFLERISWYHTMLAVPRWKFLGIIFTFPSPPLPFYQPLLRKRYIIAWVYSTCME